MVKRILFSCLFTLLFLFGCQTDKTDTTEMDSNETTAESSENENENANEPESDQGTLPDEHLQKLNEGAPVKQLQQALIQIGYPLEETGTYDEMTTWAITDLQLAQDSTYINGIYNKETKAIIQEMLDGEEEVTPPYELEEPEKPDVYTDVVENPYEILSVANKDFALSGEYEPIDLTIPDVPFPFSEDNPKKQLRKEAAGALEELFSSAEEDDIHLFAVSGYRSYERQESIFAANVEQDGEEHANTYSAKPGESEHQTGLVMDISSEDVGFDLTTDFGATTEGEWVKNHSHEYGFIIRYPKGKEDITQYQYEPWHLRFVGVEAATKIKENEETLEEYLSVPLSKTDK